MSDTLEDTKPKTDEFVHEPGDHERFSHYVSKKDWDEGYLNGTEVTALCGHKWIPTKDPERFSVCPKCKEIHESLPPE